MYGQLSTEFYDAEKPKADDSEIEFFARHVANAEGRVLEAMCGSGRLLIPLLKRGFQIDGVDNSEPMLRRLSERCLQNGLRPPKTFLQDISELSLSDRYSLIFIALGSIQLLSDEKALTALERLRDHLAPSGCLLLDTFIPWDLIDSKSGKQTSTRKVGLDHDLIFHKSEIEIDRERQMYRASNRYERRNGDVVLDQENEILDVKWYSPDSLTEILKGLGFSVKRWDIPRLSPRPRRHIFEAYLPTR